MSGEVFEFTTIAKMIFGAAAVTATWTADRIALLVTFFAGIGFQFALVVVAVFRAVRAVTMSRPGMIKLELPRAYGGLKASEPAPPRESLCHSCALAHIVRGYERDEEVVMCGYAFPPRAVLFAVRECTDHKL